MRGDINLLPKKKTGEITRLATGFVVSIFVILGIVAVVFVYMPNMERRRISKEIEHKKSELAEQTASREKYNQLLEELKILRRKNFIFTNIKDRNLAFSGVLEDFEAATPTSIVLEDLTYINGLLYIEGKTPSALELSQYMVNLRKLDNVIYVSLTSMELETERSEGDTTPELYDFELSVVFYEDINEEAEEDIEEEAGEDIENQEETTDENDLEEEIIDEGAQ